MYQILFLKAFPGSFLIFVVSIQVTVIMPGFEPGTSGVGENCSSNCTTPSVVVVKFLHYLKTY